MQPCYKGLPIICNENSIIQQNMHFCLWSQIFGSLSIFITRFKTKRDDLPKWFTDLAGEKDTCTSYCQLAATKASIVPLSFLWLLFTSCQRSSLCAMRMQHSSQWSCHSNPTGKDWVDWKWAVRVFGA